MALTLLAILIAALLVLAALSALLPRRIVALGCAGACGLVIVLAIAALAVPDQFGTQALALGPPGAAMRLALTPLAAAFLLLVFLAALACALCGEVSPVLLGGMVLVPLAADALSLAAGLLLIGSAGSLRLAAFGAVCLMAALSLAGVANDAVLPLVVIASCALLGVLSRAVPLAAIACAPLAITLPLRLLLPTGGPPQPLLFAVLPLVLGGIAVLAVSLRAAFGATLHAVLSSHALSQLGMAAIGVGIALLARAVDRPDIALLALQAAWLWLACHVLDQALLLLCADAVEVAAETRRLDRLGGLVHGMPRTALCMLVGLYSSAVLPPGLGFAAFWMLLQSLLAITRIGGLGLQYLVVGIAALAALSAGMTAVAAVRLFAVAFLGRPRTPRTAVAEEPPRRAQYPQLGLAALIGLLGVFPALALLPAAPALALLSGGSETPLATPLLLPARGYSPIATIVLVLLAAAALIRGMPGFGSREASREVAWNGGFAPPPAWLPFGDPTTQYGPVSFVEPVRRVLELAGAASSVVPRFRCYGRALAYAGGVLRTLAASWSVSAAVAALVLAMLLWTIAS